MAYCVAADIQRVLGRSTAFSGSTNPTSTQIASMIDEAEDTIDQEVGHSWQGITVTQEYYDLPRREYGNRSNEFWDGIPIYLKHREITTLASGSGDKIEVWEGSQYVDWLATMTEGRSEDWWIDYKKGILYLRVWPYGTADQARIRMTYRYGGATVPKDIQNACAIYVALMILEADSTSSFMSDGGGNQAMVHDQRYSRLKARYDSIIENRMEIQSF